MNELLDQFAISLLIEQYFYGVDRRDAALIRNCFADEATYSSDAGALNMDSGDEIGRRLGRGGRYAQTSHIRSSQRIEVTGDTATADTYAIAYLVTDTTAGGAVLVRGLQYRDTLARKADGWKIVRRHHSTKWQYEETCTEPMPV